MEFKKKGNVVITETEIMNFGMLNEMNEGGKSVNEMITMLLISRGAPYKENGIPESGFLVTSFTTQEGRYCISWKS